jgi:hypothetical protein
MYKENTRQPLISQSTFCKFYWGNINNLNINIMDHQLFVAYTETSQCWNCSFNAHVAALCIL